MIDCLPEKAFPEQDHPAVAAFSALARELGIWLLAGSVSINLPGSKVANRSILIGSDGQIAARYDKIHLFDVDLGNGERYKESATIEPGTAAVVAPTPWGNLGMTVCYDLRFPHLYRQLAKRGAHFLSVPAAFTRTTGRGPLACVATGQGDRKTAVMSLPRPSAAIMRRDAKPMVIPLLSILGERCLRTAANSRVSCWPRWIQRRAEDARRKIPSLSHDRSFE